MIITQLNGGLGNQMFQYAAGRCLAYSLKTELKLDISRFRQDTFRNYDLSVFSIRENIASDADLNRVRHPLPWMIKHPIKTLKSVVRQDVTVRYVKESQYHFDPAFFNLPENVYLEGYWQSEKYFKKIEPLIRQEFRLHTEPKAPVQELAVRIREGNAISIHIRRGDFVKNAATNATHGVCSPDYYHQAVEKISRQVDDARFWIFSDDPAWVKENITVGYPSYYVSDHHFNNYEDMYLMSCCRHHIIANSSFSWWGAYLDSNPGKIVIAPKRWFKKTDISTTDLLPESWIRI
jgi:Glycosyl transferase family 11